MRVSKNAKNTQNSRNTAYATCGTVSIIGLRAHIEHRAHSLHCCEPCRASDRYTAVEILDRCIAINSLRCSDEQGVSALGTVSMLVICVLSAEFQWK